MRNLTLSNFRHPHEKTFQIIKEGINSNKQFDREIFIDELRQAQDIRSRNIIKLIFRRLQFFLFIHPCFILLFQLSILILFSIIANILNLKEQKIELRLIFIVLFLGFQIILPLLLNQWTPRFEIGWDRLWPKVLGYYLYQLDLDKDINGAKQNIKRSILYYKRKGYSLNVMINLLWGSIFIGCLPDSNFQEALINVDFFKLIELNKFGSFSLIFTPLLFGYYFINYDLRITWMENVLTQIEIDE